MQIEYFSGVAKHLKDYQFAVMISEWKLFSVNGASEFIYTDAKVTSLTPNVTLSLSARVVVQQTISHSLSLSLGWSIPLTCGRCSRPSASRYIYDIYDEVNAFRWSFLTGWVWLWSEDVKRFTEINVGLDPNKHRVFQKHGESFSLS